MSSKNSKMASALRAGLGKEDAALAERLPDVQAEAVMAPQPEAPAATTEPAAVAESTTSVNATPAVKSAPGVRESSAAKPKAAPKAKAAPRPKAPAAKPEDGVKPVPTAVPTARTDATAAAKAPKVRATKAPVIKAEVVPPVVDVGVATSGAAKRKPAKGVKESFTMLAAEHRRLKLLRASLAVGSRKPSRSDMLRAALGLLEASDKAEVSRLLDALPAMAARKKGGKKR